MAARAGVSDVLPQRVQVSIPGAVLAALLEASQSVRGNTEGVLLGDSSLARCRAPPTDGSDAAKVVDSVTVGTCGLGGTGLGLVQLAWPSPDGPAGGGMRMPPGVQRFSEIGHGFSFYGTSGELQWDVLGPALRHSAEEVRAAPPSPPRTWCVVVAREPSPKAVVCRPTCLSLVGMCIEPTLPQFHRFASPPYMLTLSTPNAIRWRA